METRTVKRETAGAREAQAPFAAPKTPRLLEQARRIEEVFALNPGEDYARSRTLLRDFLVEADRSFNPREAEKIYSATALALALHLPQAPRADNDPMINHILRVPFNLVAVLNIKNCDMTIAALLHDAVEDQPLALAKLGMKEGLHPATTDKAELQRLALKTIERFFGSHVATLVRKLTNEDYAKRAKSMLGTASEEQAALINRFYQEHVFELAAGATKEDREAFAIKMADFMDNALRHAAIPTQTPEAQKFKTRMTNKRGILMEQLPGIIEKLSTEHPLYGARRFLSNVIRTCYEKDYKPLMISASRA